MTSTVWLIGTTQDAGHFCAAVAAGCVEADTVALGGGPIRVPVHAESDIIEVEAMIPYGLHVIGIEARLQSEDDDANSIKKELTQWANENIKREAFVISIRSPTGSIGVTMNGTSCHAALQPIDYFDQSKGHILVRLRAELQASWDAARATHRAEIDYVMADLKRILYAPNSVMLHSDTATIFSDSILSEHTLATLAPEKGDGTPTASATPSSKKKNTKKAMSPPQTSSEDDESRLKTILDVKLMTLCHANDSSKDSSTLELHVTKAAAGDRMISTVNVDAVAICTARDSLASVVKSLRAAAARQLAWTVPTTMRADHRLTLTAFHFRPLPSFPFPISAFYPLDEAQADDAHEKYLEKYRRRLHKRLLLPEDHPLFRTARALDSPLNSVVIDPTESCLTHTVPNADLSLVSGTYDYYHYMQDNFNDNGWGCSYRSFQTLCSWVLHQDYGTRAVPSHLEIQQALVDLDDKGTSFVGSKQWIGSFEISLLMDYFYGISCKIMHLASGSEFLYKARELARHFETEGSPVMIGGGVLAYTLLGVAYNERTGDARFLILDPHYTGREDVATIIARGWCGWKKPDLFLASAFYNLCLPGRPRMI